MHLREQVATAIDAREDSQRQSPNGSGQCLVRHPIGPEASGRRHGGPQTPRRRAGPTLGFPERVRLAMRIAEHPDATLKQLKEWGGFACTLTTLWGTLRRFRLNTRRSPACRERDTPEVQAKRRRYRAKVRRIGQNG